jgi:hypothetical protein
MNRVDGIEEGRLNIARDARAKAEAHGVRRARDNTDQEQFSLVETGMRFYGAGR